MTSLRKMKKAKYHSPVDMDNSTSNYFSDNEEDCALEDKFKVKKWFEEFAMETVGTKSEVKFEELESLRREAKAIMHNAVALNNNRPPKSVSHSDFVWMKTIMAKGTKGDKIAAYVVMIQDSPLYNLNLLNNIIGMVKVGKKEWVSAAETLQELFLNYLLPPNRKLTSFSHQPLSELKKLSFGNESKRKTLLLLWYFENQLKTAYRDFIIELNNISHDSVDANKEKAITVMFKLLENNPEQESVLLSNIVNKLGDPSHKVGSKVIYTLTKLLQTHPNMREVVMEEVEKLVFRPNISKRAQYYSICFLAQFCLSKSDVRLAKKLISIYLSVFKACVKMGEIDSRMMSALLTGVNRAYPFAKNDANILQEQVNTIYKVVHFGKPSVSIQALSLLYLMSGETGSVSDRFFMVLYKKVSELALFNSTHHAMFLSLIFKALKKDKRNERVSAFLKRLLQVSTYLSPPIVCGILFIISEIVAQKKNVLLVEQKAGEGVVMHVPTYMSDSDKEDEVDGYEHYEDVPLESDSEHNISVGVKSPSFARNMVKGGCVNCEENNELMETRDENVRGETSKHLKVWRNPDVLPEDRNTVIAEYNPYHRNPLYAGGLKSVYVELHKLANHYHPSVSLFATNILKGEKISYNGDPLKDFALIRFLDKFSFKNPKALKAATNAKETFYKFGKRKLYNQIILSRLKVNKEDYLKQNEKFIPADERFIYSYLKRKQSTLRLGKDEDESDIESVGSDEFEEMLRTMTENKGEEDIDFLNEAGQLPTKNTGNPDKEESGSEYTEEMSDDESVAEDFDGDELDDLSDNLLEGSEIDESELPPSLREFSRDKRVTKGNSKRPDVFSRSKLFASAEEFSELLEQADYRAGGANAMSNRDNAGLKQLKWEDDRNKRFIMGNKRKHLKNPKSGGKSKGRIKKRL